MIHAQGLGKCFKSYKKAPGLRNSIQSLFKRQYTSKWAVADFDLQVEQGELVGLLGPNGAGKTTLMKMMTGIIVPSQGELQVLGHNPWQRAKEFRKKMALVMGQKSQLWWDIPAMDSFYLLQKYYEIEEKQFLQKINLMSELLNVQKLLHIQVRRLSLGERMKLELMAGLLHGPQVIFLDEPTIGLDLIAQENIRQFILDYHHQYKPTVVLTSHYMDDVKALCQRLVLVQEGKKHFDGSMQSFATLLGEHKELSFTFKQAYPQGLDLFKDKAPLWDGEFKRVELKLSEEEVIPLTQEVLANYPVADFATAQVSIEKVMMNLMRKS